MADEYTINCTGDVCVGDVVRFTEAVFDGSFRRPRHVGDRTLTARVVSDSYGSDRQQHTFTLEVLGCEGTQPVAVGSRVRRKGRNVYRNGTWRAAWDNESERGAALNEKHTRGDAARAARDARRSLNHDWR